MKRKKLLMAGVIMVCMLVGCGNVGCGPAGGSPEGTVEGGSAEPVQPDEGGTGGQPQEGGVASGQPVENSAESSAEVSEESSAESQAEEVPSAETAELDDDEKQFFTEFIQEVENYGFLLSDYDVPRDVKLEEVFYGGAGFGEWIPEEDIPLYLEAAGTEEIYTDCLKLPGQDIEDFLQRKLGIGLEDMSSPLDMLYLAKTDSYYHEAGDTNYAPFACTGGIRQGDTYTLHFTPAADWLEGFGDRETVLLKTGDGYRFLSNHIVTE